MRNCGAQIACTTRRLQTETEPRLKQPRIETEGRVALVGLIRVLLPAHRINKRRRPGICGNVSTQECFHGRTCTLLDEIIKTEFKRYMQDRAVAVPPRPPWRLAGHEHPHTPCRSTRRGRVHPIFLFYFFLFETKGRRLAGHDHPPHSMPVDKRRTVHPVQHQIQEIVRWQYALNTTGNYCEKSGNENRSNATAHPEVRGWQL